MDMRGRSQVAQLRLGLGNFSIYEGVNTIGRNRDATVTIKNMKMSQNHAIIVVHEEQHYISDLNSSNGCFCEGKKMEPFKLYNLRNRIEITLGELTGIYVTNPAFFEGNKPSHSTTLESQSFYGSNTQPLEDIHEAPTQEIVWTNLKSNNSNSSSKDEHKIPVLNQDGNDSVNRNKETTEVLKNAISQKESDLTSNDCQETDSERATRDRMSFFEEPTQVFDIRPLIRNSCQASDADRNKTNDNMRDCKEASTSNRSQMLDNLETITKKVQKGDSNTDCGGNKDQVAASTSRCQKLDNIVMAKDKEQSDDEMTDCEEDMQATTSTSDCQKLGNVEALKNKQEKINEEDEMTDCEEDALPDALFSNVEENTRVKDYSKQDDDEMTDCEEDSPTNNQQKLDKVKEKSDDDEMTDCDENEDLPTIALNLEQKTSQNNKVTPLEENPEIDSNDSNESLEFFKVDKSNDHNESGVFLGFENVDIDNRNTDKSDKSNSLQENQKIDKSSVAQDKSSTNTDKSTIVQDNSDTDDDSITTFASHKKKKSLMVLSTQDFDDSYLKNQTKKSTIDMDVDDEIPATQYQCDLVPDTQQISTRPNKSENANKSSSEESFKLGITEYMADYMETLPKSTIEACKNRSIQDIFNFSNHDAGVDSPSGTRTDLNTFRAPVSPEIGPCGSKETNLDDSDFVGPTQQIENSSTKPLESKNTNLDDTDLFAAPTQKIRASPSNFKKHDLRDDEDIFDAPTQKVTQQDDSFLSPTQKLTIKGSNKEKLCPVVDDMDIFAAPTQKIRASPSHSKKHDLRDDEDIYDAPTQKVTQQDDIFMSPTQKLTKKTSTKKSLCAADDTQEIYDAATQIVPQDDSFLSPTQKLTLRGSRKEKSGHIEELQEIYDAPTQKTPLEDDDSLTPTQKLTILFEGPLGNYSTPNQNVAHTQKLNSTECSKNKFDESLDIFDVATQIVPVEQEKVENINDTNTKNKENANVELLIKRNNDESMESANKSSQKVEKKKIFAFKKSDLDATISDLADKTSKKTDKVEGIKIEKLTIKKTKEPDSKVGALVIKEAKEQNDNEETTIKKRATRKPKKLENVKDNTIEKLTIKSAKEPANAGETKIEKLTIKNNKKSDIGEDIKIEKLTIKSAKEPPSVVVPKIEKLTIKSAKEPASVEGTKIEKLTIKKNTSTRNTHKFFNSDEHLIPKFLTETTSDINYKESTSFNASNNEQNKSLALFESKINQTKRSANFSEELKITVPTNRRSKSIATIEEVQLETNKRTSKRRGKKTEEVPAKKVAKDDKEKVSSVSSRKISTRKIAELELEIKPSNLSSEKSEDNTCKIITPASNSNSTLASVPEENPVRKGRATRVKNSAAQEANNNNDENLKESRAGTSRQTKSKKRQPTDDNVAGEKEGASPSKRQKLQLVPETPSTSSKVLRKQRPKVVFTMMENPKLESLIKQLGGSIVDSVENCTVLITEHVKRTHKLMTAIGLGKPICSPKWIIDSKQMQEFLDPWDYILTDAEAENKWNFSLRESLTRSRDLQLLRSYSFFIQVTNGVDVLKGAIDSCGGKILPKIPATPSEGTYIISCPENRSKYSRILKKNPDFKVIEAEAVFDGVLRQELRFERHLLK